MKSTDYNYYESVKEDIRDYITNEWEEITNNIKASDIDETFDKVYNDMFISDSITGNASGSYTFSTWKAEENLCHNWDLLEEACAEFSIDNPAERGAEYCDVLIRCYLLGSCLTEVWEEYIDDWKELEEEEKTDVK